MIRRVVDFFGTLRVVGLRSAYWYCIYRLELFSGISRGRTPLRSWEEILERLPPAALEWNPARRPLFFYDDPEGTGAMLRRIAPESESGFNSEWDNIQKGSYRLWEDARYTLGFPPNWNRNPLTARMAPTNRHWSETGEETTGDIKGLWELSRFSVAFHLARWYAASGNERAPEAFWQLVESWMGANPPNAGPQWISSQEVALRAMAWIFALHVFAGSPATTAARLGRILAALDAHARRIEATLAYAKAQNNNHLISEAAGLFTIGLMFPDLPDAARWSATGRALLEATAGQFFPDGGYIQHSTNYHRLALQLYAWVLRLAEINSLAFSKGMYSRVDRSLELLSSIVDPDTGRAPNFGHSDGALFLALNSCAYEDYRPLLQMLSVWRRGTKMWEGGLWDEDSLWLFGADTLRAAGPASPLSTKVEQKPISAPDAGLFVLPGRESRAIIRCARFRSRPAHADQLHIDLWWHGENLACDSGSYLYGGDPPWRNSLTHAALHNTVTVDGSDQMTRSGRFGWATLAQARGEFFGKDKWQGAHDGYRALGITHRRLVERIDGDVWIVTDDLIGKGTHSVRLHWLIQDYPWEWVQQVEEPKIRGFILNRMAELGEASSGGESRLALRTPIGNISLALRSSEPARWSVYRAGERVYGAEELAGPVPVGIRGWRSPRYAKKIPALSVAGVVTAELPIRYVSVWFKYIESPS